MNQVDENGVPRIKTGHHIATLRRRVEFLQKRIDRETGNPATYDLRECAALRQAVRALEYHRGIFEEGNDPVQHLEDLANSVMKALGEDDMALLPPAILRATDALKAMS